MGLGPACEELSISLPFEIGVGIGQFGLIISKNGYFLGNISE